MPRVEVVVPPLADRGVVDRAVALMTAMGKTPLLDNLVDDYWRLRLRRLMHEWRAKRPPTIVTHDLVDDTHDEILIQLRQRQGC